MSVVITELTPAEQYLEIFDGETSSFLSVEGENYVEVHSGGTLTDSVVTELSFVVGDQGSLVKSILVTSGSEVYADGEAEDLIAESKGQFSISYGARLKKGRVNAEGTGIVYSSALATDVSVTGGKYFVNGGTAGKTIVHSGDFAVQTVQSGEEGPVYTGLAQSTTLLGGTMRLENGGTSEDTVVSAGLFRINSGSADKTTVAGGSMIVSVGNTASNTTVDAGNVEIESAAAEMTVLNGGKMRVLGGTAQTTTLNGGELEVLSGTAVSAVVGSGAVLTASEATLESVTLNGGELQATTASVAGLTMNDGEFQGTSVDVSGLTVKGGTAALDAASTLSGKAVFAEGASITVDGRVAFDTQFATDEEAQITGAFGVGENVSYTLTAEPTMGVYLLATDATGLFATAAGITFGDYTLTLDTPVKINDLVYTLNMGEDASLTLTIAEPLTDVVFVNSEWAELEDGSEVEVSGITATVGVNAFAKGDDAAAVAVAADGKIRIVGGVVDFTSPIIKDTAVYSGAILKDSEVAATGKLVVNLGGTLTGRMTFVEGATVTVNGNVLFDTAVATAETAQFSGLSVASGNMKCSLLVADEQANGSFLLASGAAGFNKTITVRNSLDESLGTLKVGQTTLIGASEYTLAITENDDLALTIEAYVPPTPTLAYVNSEWSALEPGATVKIGTKSATIGYDAFAALDAAIAGVTEDGSVEVTGGEISFGAYSKTVTVDTAARVVGKNTFDKAITINGTVAFDTAVATAEAAQINGLSFVSGAAKYTLTDAAPAAGTYLLAADAASFNSTVKFGDVTLSVGAEAAVVDDFTYALSLTEGTLALTVAVYVPPTPTLAYVDGGWSDKKAGDIVKVGKKTAKIGYDAFAVLGDAIAAVTEDGSVEIVGGTINFAEGYSKTITVDAAATVVGKNTFDKAITINGTVAFDTAVATAEAAQFGGFSFVSGTTKYTLTDAAPAAGTYLLAADVTAFTGVVMFGANKLTVGADAVLIGDFTYALSLTEGTLALTVAEFVPPVPTAEYVYVNSAWSGLVSGTTVAVGDKSAVIGTDAFATGDIAVVSVVDGGTVEVVGGEVNFNKAVAKNVTVDAGATLIGKATFAAPVTVNGTVAFDTAFASAGSAQFAGFSFVTGSASYTLTVAAPAAGTWKLASEVTGFTGSVMFGDVALAVGAEAVAVGDFTYALTLTEDILALTVAEYVPPVPALAYVNSEWSALEPGATVTVGEKTAAIGYDAFATLVPAIAAVTEDGAVEIVGGTINFADGYGKTITVDADATVVGKNTFDKAITINGTVAFDTASATSEAAQINGLSFVSGAAKYTLTDAVPAAGTYLLAADAAAFDSTVQFGDVALTVGAEPVTVGDFTYALTLTEGTLALTVAVYVPPAPILAYVNSEWSALEPGATVTVGEKTAKIGYDAFAALAPAIAAVTEDGSVEIAGGTINFAEGYSKTITVDADATVVGKNTFDKAITINGTVAFDTAFATAEAAQFDGFSFVSGTAEYTLTAAAPAAGTYLLAAAAGFIGDVQFGDVTLSVGAEPVVVGDFTYALTLTEGTLALTVAVYVPPVDLYVNSDWGELEPGTEVTIGGVTAVIGTDAFATGDEANAVAKDNDRIKLVNGEAFFTGAARNVFVFDGAKLLIDNEAGLDNVFVQSGGVVSMTNGVMSGCSVAGGYLAAESGAVIDGLTVYGIDGLGASLDGATAKNAVISGVVLVSGVVETPVYCSMSVAGEGGLVQNATVADGGRLLVSSGARAENIVLSGDNETYMEGELNVSGGGMASGIMVSSGGYLACWRDGSVDDVVIMEGGQAYLYGSGSKAQVSGGLLGVQAGGAITGVTVAAGGSMWTVNSAGLGSAFDTEIQSGGSVYNAGYMSNTMILGGGTMTCAYGFAELTEVQSGGVIEVSNGTMRGVTVQSGGVLAPDEYCYGGTFTGHVTVLEGATVSMAANQTINFDISGLPDPDTDYIPLVVGYSFIEGTPALTLTVSEEGQAAGKYLLANGVTSFDRGITFGEYTLTVGGEPVKYNGSTYKLGLSDGVLVLSVISPMPHVYVNSAWAELEDGTTVTIDEEAGITAVIGIDAFATGDPAVANTTEDGVVEVIGGSVSFGSLVDRDLVIGRDATLTGKAAFADGVSITMNGTAAFDTQFATATEAQFTGFSATGDGGATLTVQDGHAVAGSSYLLATDAASLIGSEVVFGDFTYTVGGIDFHVDETVGKKGLSYALDLNGDRELVLSFVKVVNGPDDRKNDWLYNKSLGGLNPNVGTFQDSLLADGISGIAVDRKGSVKTKINGTTYYNFVSMNDTADYAKITLDSAARLSFTVSATDAAKFVVYSLVTGTDKKGNTTYTMKALQTTSLKKDKTTGLYGATTKNLLLDLPQDGENKDYYISVQSTNKNSTAAGYNVSLNYDAEAKYCTLFYSDGDDGTNNWLYNKKDKENPVNTALAGSTPVTVNRDTGNVQVDAEGSVHRADEDNETVWTNFTGFGDDTDFVKIALDTPSKLSFDVKATAAAKFIVYSFTTGLDKKGNTTYTLKALQTTSLKKAKDETLYTASTKSLLLDLPAENQQYYIAVQSTNAKKGDETYYNVSLGELGDNCGFYVDADDGWNNYVYDKKNTEAPLNLAVYGADPFMIGPETVNVQVDAEGTVSYDDGRTVWTNFAGFGDDTDFVRIGLVNPASLSFSVNATAAAKFTIWSLTTGLDKKGNVTYTLKALQTTKLKKTQIQVSPTETVEQYTATTKSLLLGFPADNQEYFISVQSTNAKKGDSAYYNVTLDETGGNLFYLDADNGWNNYLYDKNAAEPVNPNLDEFVSTDITKSTTAVLLDKEDSVSMFTGEGEEETEWKNFVGFGDDTDFARIRIGNNTSQLSFSLTATDAAKFVIYSFTKVNAGGGNYIYSMQALQTTTLKKAKGSDVYTADTKALALAKGEYYIAMQSTNAAKGTTAYYNVSVNQAMSGGLPKAAPSAAAELPDDLFAGQSFDAVADAAAFNADAALFDDMRNQDPLLA